MIILDIGCGFSYYSDRRSFKKYKANPRGEVNIDIHVPSIKISNFVRSDAHFLPFRSNVFNTVTMIHTIEHLKNPSKALEEVRRVLFSHGRLILETPNIYSKDSWIDPNHVQHFNVQELRSLLLHYFRSVQVYGVGPCWFSIVGLRYAFGKLRLGRLFPKLSVGLSAECIK